MQLAIRANEETTGAEDILDEVLVAIKQGGNEIEVIFILGIDSAIVGVDSDDAGTWITLGVGTADFCFYWGNACDFSTLRDDVLFWFRLWFGSLWW